MRSSISWAPRPGWALGGVLGAALLLAELWVAGLSLFAPHVDRDYADFYISGARSCWVVPGEGARDGADLRVSDIAIGKLSHDDACYLLGAGWSFVEKWGVWSAGPVVSLNLPVVAGKHAVVLTVSAFSPKNRQSVRIFVNGAERGGAFVPAAIKSTLLIDVPPGTSALHIVLRIKHPLAPASLGLGGDQRQLGIALISIHWQ